MKRSEPTQTGRASRVGSERVPLCAIARPEELAEGAGEEPGLFTLLADCSPVGVYIVQDRVFVYVNPQFEVLTGYSAGALIGKNALSLAVEDDRERTRTAAIAMLKGERHAPYEYRLMNHAGETRSVMETVSSIHYRRRRATLGNYMDITDRVAAERELCESRAALTSALATWIACSCFLRSCNA